MRSFEYDTTKTSRTFYTEEKVLNAKKNIGKFDWAKKEKNEVVAAAEEYLEYGIDRLLVYVTQQNLPRSYGVNQMKGCPVCGKGIDKFGNYPYLADPLGEPFKLKCPNCKSVFPSNDFDSYYKSGLDEDGRFHYDKADSKYLINELYPDKPSDWCVDNGFGWIDPVGCKTKSFSTVYDKEKGSIVKDTTIGDNRYTFIAYFNHWYIWIHNFNGVMAKGLVTSAIANFRDAYLYTGDEKYAQAGLVILNRVADFYREFDACVYKWEDNFRHSGGAWGKIVGSIWEEGVVDHFIMAYDAFFPAINKGALDKINSEQFYINNPVAPKMVKDIKLNIENNILYQILPEVINHRIRGNFGMHQGTIALAALVLQNEEYFDRCIDLIFSTTDKQPWGPGNIDRILVDEIDHDGAGNETSVGYNGIWINGMNSIASILKGTPKDLFKNEKFLKMFNLEALYIIADKYTLNIGDAGSACKPFTTIYQEPHVSLFQHNGDVKSAQLLHLAAGIRNEKTGDKSIVKNMFIDCEKLEEDISNTIKENGTFKTESKNYSGYGISKIEIRNEKEPKSVWLYYGRNTGHGHRDTLMLGFYGYGVFLNPDHGYPCFADGNHERRCWTVNTISHDTVMVDDRPGRNQIVGIPHHFDASSKIGVMDVETPLLYKQTTCYRRTCVTVNINDIFYTADFFRVTGGKDHRYVFHGAEGEAESRNLNLIAQNGGTYAGEDVEFASVEYDETHSDGFDYLYDVKRDNNVIGAFTVDWKVKDTFNVWKKDRDVHIAITELDPADEVVIAKGMPPQNKPGNPKEYTYLIAHNTGEDLKSQFASIIEPYEDVSEIISAESIPLVKKDGSQADFTAKAVKVTMKDGRVDYILNSIDDETYIVNDIIEFRGFLAVISEKNGIISYKYVNDIMYLKFKNETIICEPLSVTGQVMGFTKELSIHNKIIVKLDKDICPGTLIGTHIDIETDKIRNGFYEILSAELNEQGLYELNIGDISLIRAFEDPADKGKGYRYNISEGAKMRIALAKEI